MKNCLALYLALTLCLGCAESPVAPDAREAEAFAPAEPPGSFAAKAAVDRVALQVFLPAGDLYGRDEDGNFVFCSEEHPCTLVPGTLYPPTKGSHGKLLRGKDFVQVNLHTTGLPPGAYTVWWAFINETGACVPSADPEFPDIVGECGFDDMFDIGGPSVPSVFWATGGIVPANGVGNFSARTRVGDELGTPGTQHLWGPGVTNPEGALVISIIKYHGPASDDPEVLYEQTHTLLGSCDQGFNGFDGGDGSIQCFDPQWALFMPDHGEPNM